MSPCGGVHTIMFNGDLTFQETNQNNGGTNIFASYDLDTDGDGFKEWTFELEFSLQGNRGMGQFGEIYCRVHPTTWPVAGVDEIVYPFLFDADVYDSPGNNRIFRWDVDSNPQQWTQIGSENSYTQTSGDLNGYLAYIDNPQAQRSVKMKSLLGQPQCAISYTALRATGTEYSQWPADYDNDENLNGADGLIWYIETWNCNQQWPPCGANGFTGVVFDNIQA